MQVMCAHCGEWDEQDTLTPATFSVVNTTEGRTFVWICTTCGTAMLTEPGTGA